MQHAYKCKHAFNHKFHFMQDVGLTALCFRMLNSNPNQIFSSQMNHQASKVEEHGHANMQTCKTSIISYVHLKALCKSLSLMPYGLKHQCKSKLTKYLSTKQVRQNNHHTRHFSMYLNHKKWFSQSELTSMLPKAITTC